MSRKHPEHVPPVPPGIGIVRLMRKIIPLLAVPGVVILVAVGLDESAQGGPTVTESRVAQAIPPEDIEGGDGLAGTLLVRPRKVEAGDEIAVALRNDGGQMMGFGYGFMVQRLRDGRWRDVTLKALGDVPVPAILLFAQPGETHLADRVRLKRRVKPGRYRATKIVCADPCTPVDEPGGTPRLRLDGRFVVRP
jgi:hypothetical protein